MTYTPRNTFVYHDGKFFGAIRGREEEERTAACLNALEGIDLSTLRDGWLADLIKRAQAGAEMVGGCDPTRVETHSAPAGLPEAVVGALTDPHYPQPWQVRYCTVTDLWGLCSEVDGVRRFFYASDSASHLREVLATVLAATPTQEEVT